MSRYYPAVSRKSFWFNPPWPRDAPDGSYIFLGNAVLATGRAIFGDEWSDQDPQAAFSHKESVVTERARVAEVMERLGVAIARGDVRFALRTEQGGGEFKPQKEAVDPRTSALVGFGRANWNVDDFTPLFKFAQMDDGRYRVEQVPPLDWIYLERQTFDRFIAGLAPPLVSADESYTGWMNFLSEGLPHFRDERAELIEAVESGQMFSTDAEVAAKKLGLSALNVCPDIADFAVMDLPDWSIEMAVAWIIWRNPEKVTQFHQPYHRLWTTPRSPFDNTPELSLAGVRMWLDFTATNGNQPIVESFEQAVNSLSHALRTGSITASAINIETRKAVTIASSDWRYLIVDSTTDTSTAFRFPSSPDPIYTAIRLDRETVLGIWGAASSLSAKSVEDIGANALLKTPPKGRTSEKRLTEAVEASVDFFRKHGFLLWTKDEAETELREMFGATRAQSNRIFAKEGIKEHFLGGKGRRGSPNPNRDKELEQFRQFFFRGIWGIRRGK